MIVQIPLQAVGPHMNTVKLHKTIGVRVGTVQVGGGAPVVVQSMTMTDTADAAGTVARVRAIRPSMAGFLILVRVIFFLLSFCRRPVVQNQRRR